MPPAYPAYDVDLYSDAVIDDPYPHYRQLRELGPVIHLPRHDLLAIARYDDVRGVLRDHATFSSARGIAANAASNAVSVGSTVTSDPPLHTAMRAVIRAPITPAALEAIRARIEEEAHDLAERLVARGRCDAITDLACHLPVTIVSDLVGLPEDGRANMLRWAAATFDSLGADNDRAAKARPLIREMHAYCGDPATIAHLRPEGWAAAIWKAARDGAIDESQCVAMMRDYVSPSLDTTILATGNLIWLFCQHPQAWERVRADPSLIPAAIDEAIRLESPVRGFTRLATRDCVVGGVDVPAGNRVLALFASANRDEQRWDHADRFDIDRDARGHLGFGFGIHVCVGMHLARLEITELLKALIPRVRRFEAGQPTRLINNVLRGFAHLPLCLH